MTIKWTVKDAIQCLEDLTNPFVKKGIGQIGQKQRLPRVEDIVAAVSNNRAKEAENK